MGEEGFSAPRIAAGRASGEHANTTAQLIAAAVSLVGSPADVRAHMRSTEEQFFDYCAGAREPSAAEFERLIALIVREQGRIIAKNRDLLRKLRSRGENNKKP